MRSRGASIQWLSAFPQESEVLYPPLTYLKYLGQKKIKNSRGIVVDVEPVLYWGYLAPTDRRAVQ